MINVSNSCETHGSTYVSYTSKPVSYKTVYNPARIVSCNKPVIFSPVYKSCHTGNICISKTARCSLICNSVGTLINSDHLLCVKLFVLVMLVWPKNLTLSITV